MPAPFPTVRRVRRRGAVGTITDSTALIVLAAGVLAVAGSAAASRLRLRHPRPSPKGLSREADPCPDDLGLSAVVGYVGPRRGTGRQEALPARARRRRPARTPVPARRTASPPRRHRGLGGRAERGRAAAAQPDPALRPVNPGGEGTAATRNRQTSLAGVPVRPHVGEGTSYRLPMTIARSIARFAIAAVAEIGAWRVARYA